MALSQDQQYKILYLLGYPYGTIEPTSLDYSNYVTMRFAAVSDGAAVLLQQLLTRLDNIDAQLDKKLTQAGIKRIDDIEFYENSHKVLKSEKARVINDLASLLGLPNLKTPGMGSVVV